MRGSAGTKIRETDVSERVVLSRFPTGESEGVSRLGQACDRLVHPSVADRAEREAQRRVLAAALAGPFLLAAAFAQVLAVAAGVPVALAAICITFVIGWTASVAIAQSGSRAIAGPALLVAGIAPAAVVIHLAGGVQSPLFLAWLPLALEPSFALRTRRAAHAGIAAAGVCVAIALALGWTLPQPATGAAAWHWFLPLAYGATVWARRGSLAPSPQTESSERRPRPIEEVIPAVTLKLGRNGEVSDCSGQARTLLKLEPEFLYGSGLLDRIHVADRVAYLSALADLREGKPSRHVELRLRLPSDGRGGEAANFRAFSLDLLGEREGGDGFLAMLRDNGELASLRQALKDASANAEIDKARFLATVSHELRTPLNAIIGFSDMLLSGMAGPLNNDKQQDYVGLVRESGEHLLAIVNSVLDVSRIESGTYPITPETFRLEEAIETSRAIVSCQAAKKSITLVSEIGDAAGDLYADRRALQQVLINLLSNAVKFTPDGGAVTVRASRQAGTLTITVSDTGIGMSADDLSRIGRPFVQVFNDYTRQHEGTGLGLSLVKGLVILQGGSMTIDSAPGLGTEVIVTLPIRKPNRREDRADAEIVAIQPAVQPRRKADEAFRQSA
jgi:cell cycle sensor histidine kinase DivJ